MNKIKTLGFAAALAALGTAPLAASAAPYYGYNGGARISGTIASVDGGAVHLQNGRTIFLKDGTVIAPSGQSLQSGERISVTGSNAGDGNINAQSITIGGYGRGNYGNYGNQKAGRRYDNDDRRRYDDNERRYDGNERRYDDNRRRYDDNRRRHDDRRDGDDRRPPQQDDRDH